MKSPKEIVSIMLEKDNFSSFLALEVLEIGLGFCKLSCTIHSTLLNGFSIAHGGITYSLADSALAFASNSYGFKAVSIETSISHLKKVKENDILLVSCTEINRSKKLGKYQVEIHNKKSELVAHFLGTVFISEEIW
jgi:acyl-CoA thioesterase